MQRAILPILLIMSAAACGEGLASDSITVRVAIEGFRNEDGMSRLLLFTSDDGFPDSPEDAALTLTGSVRGGKAEFSFRAKPGKCAIVVLHDENANGKMDKTWYGRPKEGFGTSNNPEIGFGPPEFEESVVSLDDDNCDLVITLNYL